MTKILLLEDDRLFSETLKDFLEDEGFGVDIALDPYSAYDLAYEKDYDLYLFDINLPFENGIETLKSLKQSGDRTPAIFITSRDDKDSLMDGFKAGVDDYIKKPIDLDELLMRITALLKRSQTKHLVQLGEYSLDYDKKDLHHNGKALHLGLKSFALLELLVENDKKLLNYVEIYSKVWGAEEPSNGALRVYIAKLKKYFPNAIKTIRGYGYIFDSSNL